MIEAPLKPALKLRPLRPADHEAAARLLHRSLVAWYEKRLRQGARFGESHEPFRLIPEVYAALDPGEALAARRVGSDELLGVCFLHPRATHLAIGIVATAPEAAGGGVARALMEAALAKAQALGLPARLVSSLLNLDSFSLYTRLGFVPHTIYQDMTLTVPAGGLASPRPAAAEEVRFARPDEAERLAEFEMSLQGIRRAKDYAFFLRNEVGKWKVRVLEGADGDLRGVLVASEHPPSCMLGPGVAADDEAAAALLWRALDALRGASPVFLVPCAASKLVQTCYSWGARNVELHIAQVCGSLPPARGLSFPTFLPETG